MPWRKSNSHWPFGRKRENGCGLFDRHPGEVTQFDEFGHGGVGRGEPIERNLLPVTAVSNSPFAAKSLDQDSPHRLSGSRKEMSAPLPVCVIRLSNEPKVRLMHQRRRLQSLARLLTGQLHCGQLPQLFIDQRQQIFSGLRVALLDLGQDARTSDMPIRIAGGEQGLQE
jgi:hypothetical protein